MNTDLTLLFSFCSFLSISLGTVALINNRKNNANRSFFLYTVFLFFWMTTLYLNYYFLHKSILDLSLLFVRAAYAFSVLGTFFLVVFFYYFPKKTIQYSRKTEFFFVGLALFMFLISFTPLIDKGRIVENGILIGENFGPLYIWYSFYLLIHFIFSIYLSFKKWAKAKGIDRKKLGIATFGNALFVFSTITVNVVLPIFDIWIFPEKAVVFSLLFLIPAFYSLHKHRFFNISYVSLQLLRLIVFVAFFFLLAFSIHTGLRYFLPEINEILILFISSTSALFIWQNLDKYFPLLQFETYRKLKYTIKELLTKLYSCESFNEMQKLLEDTFVVQFNISTSKIYVVRGKKERIGIPVYVRDDLTNTISKMYNDSLVLDEIEYMKIPRSLKKSLSKLMKNLDATICQPLFSEKKLIGFFVLGSKPSKSLYSKEEIREGRKLKRSLEICLMNILLNKNLHEENDHMKEVISEKTKALTRQFNKTQKLAHQQAEFMAVIAHEFRTPLCIALFQLDDILTNKEHPPKAIEEIHIIDNSLKDLKKLTQELFDVHQYDLNKVSLNKKKSDLKAFLQKTYEDFIPLMNEKHHGFSFQSPSKKHILVNFDQIQLQQVLRNLINNSAKFTQVGGEIFLKLEEKGKDVIVSVMDNGEGVTDKDKNNIFDKFQTRGNAGAMGLGLGLYLCKKIVKLHKGKIWVENTPNGGATFKIRLRK